MTPRVTAVVTVYNEERHIARAIRSLLDQAGVDLEVLVVDDGSSDGTLAVLGNIGDRRLRVLTPGRQGRAAALAFALRAAGGTYVANLDADDEALPGRLAAQAAFLDAHPDHAWIGGAEETVDSRRREQFIRHFPENDMAIRRMAARCIPYSHSGVMLRRSLLEEGVNYDPAQPFLIDFELFLRVARRHKVANLAQPVVRRHIRGESYFQRSFATGRQNRRLAWLCARAVRELGLPFTDLAFPLLRLGYPYVPNGMKRLVRRLTGPRENELAVEGGSAQRGHGR